jgi:peptidoglycan/LPS O-acetylase OafA/YrhL
MTRRIPGLDGLRALSAICVALMHLNALHQGWMGVQVFYVISGFLITSILLDAKIHTTSIGPLLKRFYYRRSLRIFPLYFTYLLLLLAASYISRTALDQRALIPSLATYTYNIHRVLHSSVGSHLSSHLWSLCIEEQFYLTWPFLVFFLAKRNFRILTIAIIFVSPLLRASLLLTSRNPPLAAYFLTPYQLDGFAAGALLSTFSRSQLSSARKPLTLILVCAAALGLMVDRHQPFFGTVWLMSTGHNTWIWGYTLIDLCAASLVVHCLTGSSLIPFLEWFPLRYVGRISYGFYVWHMLSLLFVARIFHNSFASLRNPIGVLHIITFLAVNTIVASLSFRFLEQPVMRLQDRQPTHI